MSMYTEQMFKCCNYKNKEKIKIWQSVNVTIDKKEKERILNSTFFKHKCSNCGEESYIEYEMLYHDMDKKMMVYLINDKTKKSKLFKRISTGVTAITSVCFCILLSKVSNITHRK